MRFTTRYEIRRMPDASLQYNRPRLLWNSLKTSLAKFEAQVELSQERSDVGFYFPFAKGGHESFLSFRRCAPGIIRLTNFTTLCLWNLSLITSSRFQESPVTSGKKTRWVMPPSREWTPPRRTRRDEWLVCPLTLPALVSSRFVSYPCYPAFFLSSSAGPFFVYGPRIHLPRNVLSLPDDMQLLIVLAFETFTRPRHKSTYHFFLTR